MFIYPGEDRLYLNETITCKYNQVKFTKLNVWPQNAGKYKGYATLANLIILLVNVEVTCYD